MIRMIEIEEIHWARKVQALQKAAYGEERKWIDLEVPLVRESLEELQASPELFLGFWFGTVLAGFISYVRQNTRLEICRVAVAPSFFRKGVAEALLRTLERVETGIGTTAVTVAEKNLPALRLYEKTGFAPERRFETKEGLSMIEMVKRA